MTRVYTVTNIMLQLATKDLAQARAQARAIGGCITIWENGVAIGKESFSFKKNCWERTMYV